MKKKIGIHLDPKGQFIKYLQRYEKILMANDLNVTRLDSNDEDFWEKVSDLDAFILRWSHYDVYSQKAKAIIPVIDEQLNIKCFPDMNTCWHYDDKIRQYYLMKVKGYPVVKSWIFWDYEPAMSWAENAELPVIFKLTGGAGSRNVIMIKTRSQLRKIIKLMFKKGTKNISSRFCNSLSPGFLYDVKYKCYNIINAAQQKELPYWRTIHNWQKHKYYVYFQEYLPDNKHDIRVTTIGDRAFAFRRAVRSNDFRASGSGRIDYDLNKIDQKCVQIALNISKDLDFQTMAYDFLFDRESNPHFCEISYTYQDTAVFNCSGYWDSDMNWHEGNFWPQYFHLVDLLEMPDLIQPDLEK